MYKIMIKRWFSLLLVMALMTIIAGGCTPEVDNSEESGSQISTNSETTSALESTVTNSGETSVSNSVDSGSTSIDETGSSDSGVSGTVPTQGTQSPTPTHTPIDLNKLKGSTVKVLMWRGLTDDEYDLVEEFTEQKQIEIDFIETTSTQYMQKLTSMVISKDSPDVAIIPTHNSNIGAFPIAVINNMQPVSVTGQDLNDPIWDKSVMDKYKLAGQYFALVRQGNWFSNAYCMFYNADLFLENGITTPRELWKDGKWNWNTFKQIALDVSALGPDYSGYVNTNYHALMQSMGMDYVTFDGDKFINSITSSDVIKAWTFNAEMVDSGAQREAGGSPINEFLRGEIGMYGSHTWAMTRYSIFADADFEIDAVPFPSPAGSEIIIPCVTNLFGIAKNAKNPVGAGVFLREFLDPANYPAFSKISINPGMEDTFDYVTSSNVKKGVLYSSGVVGYSNLSGLSNLTNRLLRTAPNQINTVLQSNKSMIETAVRDANKKIGASQ